MAEFPALPLWTDALIGDTFHLTPAEFGAYLRLLICAWRTPQCALPSNDAMLGRMIGDPKNWYRLKPTVMAFFRLGEDGLYRQNRLSDERDFVARRAVRSSSGGHAKSLKNRKHRSAKRVLNECLTPAPTPTPSISNTNVLDMPKRKTRISLPDNFPEDADRQWSMAYWLRFGRTDLCNGLSEEIEKFRDHHLGKLTASADWPGSWRTWTRNAIKFNHGGHNGRPQRKSNHQTFFDAAGAVAARILAEDPQTRSPGPATIVLLPARPVEPAD